MNGCGCDRTRGIWTIGNTSAADYWDWEDFVDLFPSHRTLSGNLTIVQIADIVMNGSVAIYPHLNGYRFTVTSDTPHYGNPLVGWKIIRNVADHRYLCFGCGGENYGGTMEIKNLHLSRETNWTVLHESLIVETQTDAANCTILCHDILIRNLYPASARAQCSPRAKGLASCVFKIWNWVVINEHISCQRDDPVSGGGSGICLMENITNIMDSSYAYTKPLMTDWWTSHPGTTGNQWKFRSIFSTYGLTKNWTETPDLDYVCYEIDGSQTYAVHNWNLTNHEAAMLTIDPTLADFADIKPGGEFTDRGVPLVDKLIAENIKCIRGRTRQPDNGASSDLTAVVMQDDLTGRLVGHYLSSGTVEMVDTLTGDLYGILRGGVPGYSGPSWLTSPPIAGVPAYSGPVTVRETVCAGVPAYSGPAPVIAYLIYGTIEQAAVLTGYLSLFRVSSLVSSPAELAALGDVTRRKEERWPGVGVHVFYLDDQSYRFLPVLAEDFIGPGD